MKPGNVLTEDELREAYYRNREELGELRGLLLHVLAHLEGRSDMSIDGNWGPLMIDLIRERLGWPPARKLPDSQR